MKKTLSIILIITMLLSLVVAAVPVGATTVQNAGLIGQTSGGVNIVMPELPNKGVTNPATGASAVTKPTYDESKLGNYMANSSAQEKADYLAEINAALKEATGDPNAEYIPVVNSKRDGVTPANAVLFTEINDDGHYYLWENITWNKSRGASGDPINGSGEGEDAAKYSAIGADPAIYIDDTVIDGCGHTITMASYELFHRTYNITLKNVTVKRDTVIDNNDLKVLHILQRWESRGYTKVYNLTIDVDYNITGNNDNSKATGTLIYGARANSEIHNVLNTSTITLDTGVTKMDQIGGLVGFTEGKVSVKNVVNRGAIVIKSTALTRTESVGGIVGSASKDTSFENCFNEMDITVANGAVLSGAPQIGGIAGKSGNGTTFKNCVNSGDITVGEAKTTAFDPKIKSIGGIVGEVTGNAVINSDVNNAANTYTFDTCYNTGKIWIRSDVAVVAVGDVDVKQGVAGIVGRVSGTTALRNCVNAADIISDGAMLRCFGGIAGAGQGTAISFNNCINGVDRTNVPAGDTDTVDGDVKVFQHGCTISDGAAAGGILGYSYASNTTSISFYNCTNNGDIVDLTTTESAPLADDKLVKGGIAANIRGAKEVLFSNCINNGDVVAGAITNIAYSAGMLGRYGTVGTWMGWKNDDTTLTFDRCTNNGAISARNGAGGIFAATDSEVQDGNKTGLVVRYFTFRECLNNGTVNRIGGGNAGGIAGNVQARGTKLSVVFERCENTKAITSTGSTGGIAGALNAYTDANAGFSTTYAPKFYLKDCENTGAVSGGSNVGGMTGYLNTSATNTDGIDTTNDYKPGLTVDGCINNADITSSGKIVGGVVAMIEGDDGTTANISDCYNLKNITNNSSGGGYTAGICAKVDNDAIFTNCHNYGSMSYGKDAYYDTSNGGNGSIGGVVGSIRLAITVSLTNCSNNGTIALTSGAKNACIGGVAASAWNGSTVTFTNCVNNGVVSVTADGNNGFDQNQLGAGGILGVAGRHGVASTVYFYGCVNNASVTLEQGTAKYNVGGILGVLTKGSATFGKYDNGTPDNADDDIKTANFGTITTEATGAELMGAGGILGAAGHNTQDATVSFSYCENHGVVSSTNSAATFNLGGIAGVLVKTNATFNYCKNTKNITDNCGTRGSRQGIAGMVGFAFGYGGEASLAIDMDDCVNTGALTGKDRLGGMIGSVTGRNQNGLSVIDIDIDRCVNDADITGSGKYGAGMVGYVESTQYADDQKKDAITVDINDCLNLGNIEMQGDAAAGIVGSISNSSDALWVRINDSVNMGNITCGFGAAGGNAGGIFGVASVGYSHIYIDGCINYGTISTNNYNCHGIYGQNWGSKETPQAFDSKVTNTINFGKLNSSVEGSSKEEPIGPGSTQSSCYYYSGSVDSGKVYGNAAVIMKLDQAFMVAMEYVNSDMAFSFENLEAAMKKAEPYFASPDKYAEDTLINLQNVYDASEDMVNAGFYAINDEGTVEFIAQSTIEDQTEAMLKAVEDTYLKSAMPILLESTIINAEKFMAENTNLYKAAPWNEFTSALKAAKDLYAREDLFELNYSVIYPVANRLKVALEALEEDASTLGGDILTAEDLARIAGQKGEFTLKNDITISAPVKNFKGTLNGNGYTITLDGCALFEDANGITVTNLTINGDAGEAKSVFGKAKGEVRMDNILIDVEGELEAALFGEVDKNADIAISKVISYTDASVAALVAGDCKIAVEAALVLAKAPALVTAENADVTLSYVDGTVYYNAEGESSTDADVFASGEVAYVMNQAMFGGYDNLVQRIGKDALPRIGVALVDGSNLVRFEDGKYVNLGQKIEVEVDTTPKPIPPAAPVYSELEKAIARAEALVEGDYTAESFKAVADALAAAKALQTEVQDDIDAAVAAIDLAMAALDLKPAEVASVDYSKLAEAITKAEALNVNDYTMASWTSVQVMLSAAKKAKLAATQAEVDAAIAALNGAVASLVKAPAESDAPAADDKDDTNATEPAEEEGCGSVIGGAAVILTAVLALGAGVSFKKKED